MVSQVVLRAHTLSNFLFALTNTSIRLIDAVLTGTRPKYFKVIDPD